MKIRSSLIGDLWGGISAMLVGAPAAMAYGIAVFEPVGPEGVALGIRAGLVGTVVLGLVSSLIGGTSRLISAPSAPAAAILASYLSGMPEGSPIGGVILLFGATGILAGMFQALLGASGAGRLIKYIPYPVVAGYLSAVAVTIFIGQLPKAFGLSGGAPLYAIFRPSEWRETAVVVTAMTIVAMVVAPRITRKVPAAVLGLASGMIAYFGLSLIHPVLRISSGNPLVLGPVSFGNMTEYAPTLGAWLGTFEPADLLTIVPPALTLAVLLSIDSLKSCVIVDSITFSRHNSDRTLVGQGIGNVFAAVLGGMPGSGTIGATLVNNTSGGTTCFSGVVAALAALLAAGVFGAWLGWLPISALAGVLIVVAVRMFDWSSLVLVRDRSTLLEFFVIACVIAVAMATNLVAAAGAGVGLAMLLFIREQIRGSVVRRKTPGSRASSKQHRLPAEQAVLERSGRDMVVCELQGSLFFGTTDQLFRDVQGDIKECRFLILDLRRVLSLDYTAIHLFEQFEALLRPKNGWLLFSRVPARPELRAYLNALSADEPRRHVRTFETLDDAVQWTEDRIIAEKLPPAGDPEIPLQLADFELMRELAAEPGLAALAACAMPRSFAAGDTIFQAGDSSDELFLVRRGVVRVTLPLNGNGYHTLATFGRGHFFGEMAFLVRGPRSANAYATAHTETFVISRAKFDSVSHAHPIIGVKVFARLAQALAIRLRRADAELRSFYDA